MSVVVKRLADGRLLVQAAIETEAGFFDGDRIVLPSAPEYQNLLQRAEAGVEQGPGLDEEDFEDEDD